MGNRNSKFRRLYGMTLMEMVSKYGKKYGTLCGLHYRGKLQAFLDSPDTFEIQRHLKNDSKYLRAYGMNVKDIMAFLGLKWSHTVYDLDKAGLLHHCIEVVKIHRIAFQDAHDDNVKTFDTVDELKEDVE